MYHLWDPGLKEIKGIEPNTEDLPYIIPDPKLKAYSAKL